LAYDRDTLINKNERNIVGHAGSGLNDVYEDGPFKGRQKVHPYRTVLLRLASMGVAIPDKLVAESDRPYVERISMLYGRLMDDILNDGSLPSS